MDRFTEWMDNHTHGAGLQGKDCYTKLAMYEDLELEPHEVATLKVRNTPMDPVYTTIFEGDRALKIAKKGLPNYMTYKCPMCNTIVSERSFMKDRPFRFEKFCHNCGQAIIEPEVLEDGK